MVDKQLLDIYEELNKKQELSKIDRKRIVYYINLMGLIIIIFTIIPIIPIILETYFEINFLISFVAGLFFGLIILNVSHDIGSPWAPRFYILDDIFMKVFETLNDIESYQKIKTKHSRIVAARKLSKIERRLSGFENHEHLFLGALMKEDIDCLNRLKLNFKERLIPNLIEGDDENLNEVYFIIEKFAKYLRNPTISQLNDLNEHMSKLNTYPPEESHLKIIFKHLYIKDLCVLILIISVGYSVFHFGLRIGTIDIVYDVGIWTIGTLITSYLTLKKALLVKKLNRNI